MLTPTGIAHFTPREKVSFVGTGLDISEEAIAGSFATEDDEMDDPYEIWEPFDEDEL
jgi:hypothetical protein